MAEHSAARLASGILASVSTPFVITAVFRLFDAVPTPLPFLVAIVVAAWMGLARPHLREIAVGISGAVVVHALFLIRLFGTVDPGRF